MVHHSRSGDRALDIVEPARRDGVSRVLSNAQRPARLVTSDQLLALLGGIVGGAAVMGGVVGYEFGRKRK